MTTCWSVPLMDGITFLMIMYSITGIIVCCVLSARYHLLLSSYVVASLFSTHNRIKQHNCITQHTMMRSCLAGKVALLVGVVALLVAQGGGVFVDARNAAGIISQHHAGLTASSVRGGSAVRTPSPQQLLEKKREQVERRRKELGKELADRKQQLKKQLPASISTSSGTSKKVVSPKQPSFLAQHQSALMGVLALTVLERGINKVFMAQSIKFPAQLAGCIGLFFTMIVADVLRPGMGESIYSSLLPGTNLLAKWFPVLFVPGLVMLPLAPSIGNGMEVFKFVSVAVIGLFYSMLTTAYTVLFLRKAQGKILPPTTPPLASRLQKYLPSSTRTLATATTKAYRDETMSFLFRATVVSGIISIFATQAGNEFATPVQTIFFTLATFASYVWGARLPSTITKIVHPLILSAMITLGVIQGTSWATNTDDFLTVLKTYKVGTYSLLQMGPGDVCMFLLGPSVVSFAISMFSRRQLLKDNLAIVLLSAVVSSVGGLFGTAGFVRILQLGGKMGGGMIRLSTLARNVTTALAIACTNVLQGDVSLSILIVLITGVLGATFGRTLLDVLGIRDPVTRGLAVGAAAQGLGVTSMMPEPDAFPFAAMSMILTAISATVLVSIPPVKDALVSLCQGNL